MKIINDETNFKVYLFSLLFSQGFYHGFKNRIGPAGLTGWTASRSNRLDYQPVIVPVQSGH